jgi:hypothetical protein
MNKYRNQSDRVNIVLDIVRQLKNYPNPNPSIKEPIDLYKDEYEYVARFKSAFTNYIKQNDSDPSSLKEYRGTIHLEGTLNRDVEYILPVLQKQDPLFVIRMNRKRRN